MAKHIIIIDAESGGLPSDARNVITPKGAQFHIGTSAGPVVTVPPNTLSWLDRNGLHLTRVHLSVPEKGKDRVAVGFDAALPHGVANQRDKEMAILAKTNGQIPWSRKTLYGEIHRDDSYRAVTKRPPQEGWHIHATSTSPAKAMIIRELDSKGKYYTMNVPPSREASRGRTTAGVLDVTEAHPIPSATTAPLSGPLDATRDTGMERTLALFPKATRLNSGLVRTVGIPAGTYKLVHAEYPTLVVWTAETFRKAHRAEEAASVITPNAVHAILLSKEEIKEFTVAEVRIHGTLIVGPVSDDTAGNDGLKFYQRADFFALAYSTQSVRGR